MDIFQPITINKFIEELKNIDRSLRTERYDEAIEVYYKDILIAAISLRYRYTSYNYSLINKVETLKDKEKLEIQFLINRLSGTQIDIREEPKKYNIIATFLKEDEKFLNQIIYTCQIKDSNVDSFVFSSREDIAYYSDNYLISNLKTEFTNNEIEKFPKKIRLGIEYEILDKVEVTKNGTN